MDRHRLGQLVGYGLPPLLGVLGLVAFWQVDGEAVGLGEFLIACALGCLVAAAVAVWRAPRRLLVAGLLALAATVFGLFGFYACWVAGFEGKCLLFG